MSLQYHVASNFSFIAQYWLVLTKLINIFLFYQRSDQLLYYHTIPDIQTIASKKHTQENADATVTHEKVVCLRQYWYGYLCHVYLYMLMFLNICSGN